MTANLPTPGGRGVSGSTRPFQGLRAGSSPVARSWVVCDDFTTGHCCASCHRDEEYGYGMMGYDDGEICCGVYWWLKNQGVDVDGATLAHLLNDA